MKWLLLVALSFTGCQSQALFDCADTIKKELVSPDGRYVALVFDRDCGATTKVSTQIVIREAAKRVDLKEASPVLVVKEASEIALMWDSPGALTIDLPEDAETYTKRDAWQGIQIDYR
ncbi:MAG: hypothetical protein R2862_04110 [Thermoanaerobaculia bacterium]